MTWAGTVVSPQTPSSAIRMATDAAQGAGRGGRRAGGPWAACASTFAVF